eukprot:86463-Prymnesium_polylepis.1
MVDVSTVVQSGGGSDGGGMDHLARAQRDELVHLQQHPKEATSQRELQGESAGLRKLPWLGRRARERVGGSEGCKKARRA